MRRLQASVRRTRGCTRQSYPDGAGVTNPLHSPTGPGRARRVRRHADPADPADHPDRAGPTHPQDAEPYDAVTVATTPGSADDVPTTVTSPAGTPTARVVNAADAFFPAATGPRAMDPKPLDTAKRTGPSDPFVTVTATTTLPAMQRAVATADTSSSGPGTKSNVYSREVPSGAVTVTVAQRGSTTCWSHDRHRSGAQRRQRLGSRRHQSACSGRGVRQALRHRGHRDR